VLSWPGEYNEAGISFKGIGHGDGQQISYVAEVDDVRCAFLSSPLKDWTDKQMEVAGDIDVLTIPTDDAKIAQKLIDEFDPRVLILLPAPKDDFDAIAKVVGATAGSAVSEYKQKALSPQKDGRWWC